MWLPPAGFLLCLWMYITSIRNRYITTISGLGVDQDCVHAVWKFRSVYEVALILQDPKKCKSTPEHWMGMHAIVPNQGESRAACYRQVSSFWMGWFELIWQLWRSAKQEGGRSQRTQKPWLHHDPTSPSSPASPVAVGRSIWPCGGRHWQHVWTSELKQERLLQEMEMVFFNGLIMEFHLIWYCHILSLVTWYTWYCKVCIWTCQLFGQFCWNITEEEEVSQHWCYEQKWKEHLAKKVLEELE